MLNIYLLSLFLNEQVLPNIYIYILDSIYIQI